MSWRLRSARALEGIRLARPDGLEWLHQDLIRGGELGPDGELPPVLPVVPYNGRSRWRAADEAAKLTAPVSEPLARCQPSLRCFVLDERGLGEDDPPEGNPVTVPVGVENRRSPEGLVGAVSRLPDWLRGKGGPGLGRAFLRRAPGVAAPAGSVPAPFRRTGSGCGEWRRMWRRSRR